MRIFRLAVMMQLDAPFPLTPALFLRERENISILCWIFSHR